MRLLRGENVRRKRLNAVGSKKLKKLIELEKDRSRKLWSARC